MAKNNKTYVNETFQKHRTEMSAYEGILSNSMDALNKVLEKNIGRIETSLSSINDLENELKNNAKLSTAYNEIISNTKECTDKLKEVGDISQTLVNKFGLTADELDEVIRLIPEYDKINRSYLDAENAYKANPKDKKLKSDRDNKKKEYEEKRRLIKKSNIKYKGLIDDSESIKDILKIIENKKEVIRLNNLIYQQESNIGEAVGEINENLEDSKETMAKTLELMKEAFGIVKMGAKKWVEVDDAVTKYGRSVGISTEQTVAYRKNVLDNFGQMATRLGMTFQEIMKFQEQYTKNTGRAVLLTNQQVESLAGLSKITSEIATETMVNNMDDFGASVDTASGYLTQAYARASQVGLNASKTSEVFANNIKMASKYSFKDGLNSISKMTLLSQRLKFNMESVSGALDKFSTIEGAISTSANIQLLGGAYAAQFSNPMQAMGEALLDAEGFTKRIIDTFSSFSYFDRQKGMAEMNPFEKQRMKLAAQELGINYDEAWNIAAQSAKGRAVERDLRSSNLDNESKEYLKNIAQYDTEKQAFYVNYYDENNNEQQKYISEITSKEQIEAIRKSSAKERLELKYTHYYI